MNGTEHWNLWLRDLTPPGMDPHLADLQRDANPDCPHCHGLGWEMDCEGEPVPCDECGYEDAVAEAITDPETAAGVAAGTYPF